MGKRRLGQHFLNDRAILGRIVSAAGLTPEDIVLEIGAGPGRLTLLLSEQVKKVVAVELDKKLYEGLLVLSATRPNITPVHADAMKYPYETLGPFKVVANIPYYITTPLIFELLKHKQSLTSMTLTVQKEVALRMAAPPGGKDYGVLSLSVQYHCGADIKFTIPAAAFKPPPKVDSACIHLQVRQSPPVDTGGEERFFSLIRTAFSQRRKTLSNSLKEISPNIKEVLASVDIDPRRRPETLSMEEFAALARKLSRKGEGG